MPQFPDIAPSAITPGYETTNYSSKTHSGKSQDRQIGTTLLTFDVAYSRLKPATGRAFWAFIVAQKGVAGRFDFKPALMSDSASPWAPAQATVAMAAAPRQRMVTLEGFSANQTVLCAGDLLRFANHSKAYVLAADAVSNAGGQATIELAFDLIRPVPVGTLAQLKNVAVQCSLVDNTQSIPIRPPFWHDISLKLIEKL